MFLVTVCWIFFLIYFSHEVLLVFYWVQALNSIGDKPHTIEFLQEHLSPALSLEEIKALNDIWPGDTLKIVWEVLLHHENFGFKFQPVQLSQLMPAEVWSETIRKSCIELMGSTENLGTSLLSVCVFVCFFTFASWRGLVNVDAFF